MCYFSFSFSVLSSSLVCLSLFSFPLSLFCWFFSDLSLLFLFNLFFLFLSMSFLLSVLFTLQFFPTLLFVLCSILSFSVYYFLISLIVFFSNLLSFLLSFPITLFCLLLSYVPVIFKLFPFSFCYFPSF